MSTWGERKRPQKRACGFESRMGGVHSWRSLEGECHSVGCLSEAPTLKIFPET